MLTVTRACDFSLPGHRRRKPWRKVAAPCRHRFACQKFPTTTERRGRTFRRAQKTRARLPRRQRAAAPPLPPPYPPPPAKPWPQPSRGPPPHPVAGAPRARPADIALLQQGLGPNHQAGRLRIGWRWHQHHRRGLVGRLCSHHRRVQCRRAWSLGIFCRRPLWPSRREAKQRRRQVRHRQLLLEVPDASALLDRCLLVALPSGQLPLEIFATGTLLDQRCLVVLARAQLLLEVLGPCAFLHQQLIIFLAGRQFLVERRANAPFYRQFLLELRANAPFFLQHFLVCSRQRFRLLQRPVQFGRLRRLVGACRDLTGQRRRDRRFATMTGIVTVEPPTGR